jgi:hypothetical protein
MTNQVSHHKNDTETLIDAKVKVGCGIGSK